MGDARSIDIAADLDRRAPMNKALIDQLQIDRRPGGGGGGSGRVWWILGAAAAMLAAAAAAIVVLVVQPGRVPVSLAVARASASGGPAQGVSLLDASGYVVARREATVSSKIIGRLSQVLVEEGQTVRAGQVIARLDDSTQRAALDQAVAGVQGAEANLKLAQVSAAAAAPKYRRNQLIHARGFLSDQDVEDSRLAYDTAQANVEYAQRQITIAQTGVEVARRNLDDTIVTAPFSGVVTVKAAQPGEIVSPASAGGGFTRTGICTIVDMDSLEVEVDVAESFINRVRQGMPATVKLDAYPDWAIPAEAVAVIPTADRSKATVTVRVGFKVRDPRIVPEMGARVAFLAPSETRAGPAAARSVLVPPEAVQGDGDRGAVDRGVVYVVENGRAERRAVRLGARTDAGQVLLAGISPGEEVAVGGLGKLHDGSAVRIVSHNPSSDQ